MLDFWVPGPKWQLLEALYYIYPKDKAKFKKMNKKELYAIYISARKQGK